MRTTPMAVAVALAMLAACVTEDGDVLQQGTPLTSCDQVAMRTSDEQACTFSGACAISTPSDPACCQVLASCVAGTLSLERYCEPGCGECMDDTTCERGATVCDGGRCVACADPDECTPCAAGLVPLERNGCATCICAPPSECSLDPAECMGELCYPGMLCAPGCAPEDPGCCANACAPAGCPSPAPLGCDTVCPVELNCESCVTGACECVRDTWVCRAVCGERTGVCFQPT